MSVRALHSDFLKKDHKLAEARNELEYILSKDKNNYLIWEELLLMCNEMGDTTCMYRHGIEAIKYFPEQPLPYALSGNRSDDAKTIRRSFAFVRKKALS